MKTRSAFLVVAIAVIGFAFVTPEASALPRWKASPGHLFHNHKMEVKTATTKNPERKTCCVNSTKKTADSTAKQDKRKLRPYFERKRGAPASTRRR